MSALPYWPRSALRRRLLALLWLVYPAALDAGGAAEALGESEGRVRSALRGLARRGAAERAGPGLYRLSHSYAIRLGLLLAGPPLTHGPREPVYGEPGGAGAGSQEAQAQGPGGPLPPQAGARKVHGHN